MMKTIINNMVMRRVLGVLPLCLLTFLPLYAQPGWVKKATKSVFTVKTFAADGSLLASSNGFFTGSDGEAVSNFSPFKGAARAVIIDAQGKEMPVVSIIGANDMYDVVKFRVSGKTVPLVVSASVAPTGSTAWLLPYHEQKNVKSGAVRKAETFQNDYAYYTVAMTMPQNTVSCPLINDAGEVIGMMQQPASDKDTLSYAVSARFADSLKISGFGMNEATLMLTSIKKELPADIKEAILALFLASSQQDSASYATLVNDFIQKFPQASEGFVQRAQLATAGGNFAAAEKDMETALKLAEKKDEVHYAYANMIYNKEIFQGQKPYANWSFDKALAEIQTAIVANPIDPLTLDAGYSLTIAKLKEFSYTEYASNTQAGNYLQHAPKHMAYGWAFWDFQQALKGLKAGVGFNYSSKVYVNAANTMTFDPYAVCNAMVSYKLKNHWKLQLNVNNIFDKTYYMYAVSTTGYVPEEGRNVRFTATFEL